MQYLRDTTAEWSPALPGLWRSQCAEGAWCYHTPIRHYSGQYSGDSWELVILGHARPAFGGRWQARAFRDGKFYRGMSALGKYASCEEAMAVVERVVATYLVK